MKSYGILAASLFGALAVAAPVNKRDVVWVTETAVDIVTVPVTKTVWIGADGAVPTSTATSSTKVFAQKPRTRKTVSSSSVAVPTSTSSVYVEPTTSSTSVYVEPTTSSTPVYVEPTPSSTSVYVEPTTSSTSIYVAPTTSSTSEYVAPTTSAYVAPVTTEAPSSTYVAPSTTSSAPAATGEASYGSSSGGLAGSGTSYVGDMTWYETGMGACGHVSASGDAIVAISQDIFDSPEYETANPNLNPLCGKYVSITGKDGSEFKAKVVDRCTACKKGDLDMGLDFFNKVTSKGDGRVSGMAWSWV